MCRVAFALLIVLLGGALAVGCGDDTTASTAPDLAMCSSTLDGASCAAGGHCTGPGFSCTCGTDGHWHCVGDLVDMALFHD